MIKGVFIISIIYFHQSPDCQNRHRGLVFKRNRFIYSYMNITLLLTGIAVLDVLMVCYSFHLDRQIAKLRNTGFIAVDNDLPARMGRFERFVHSPLGIMVLVLGFVGALILVKEADRRQENRDIG
ncbi:hypothetical protein G5B00_03470 [Parapedobacter sp. SGR-10]|uniref:hypothetical protein n=1 Tax=Parapedobacter sp. SGR-10 TaxID=2710879 RepID=UPI0013D1EC5D|nr:hypothetical protein [Parapedobacter sp. SGR-10]NGF55562.1 hypothetical protein [Parapedobacter sp. SGR-10]